MNNCYGEKLITLGTAIAFKIAQCQTPEQIEIIAGLLTIIGDQLALLAQTKQICNQNDIDIP